MAENKIYLDFDGLKYYTRKLNARKANIESPVLQGTPTAPTAAKGTCSTQLATTEFVINQLADYVTINNSAEEVEVVEKDDVAIVLNDPAVTAVGSVWTATETGAAWTQQVPQHLTPTIVTDANYTLSSYDVSSSGNMVVIAGAVTCTTNDDTEWHTLISGLPTNFSAIPSQVNCVSVNALHDTVNSDSGVLTLAYNPVALQVAVDGAVLKVRGGRPTAENDTYNFNMFYLTNSFAAGGSGASLTAAEGVEF